MGLELVEIIIDIEQRFGIDIPDRVAGQLRTPRQLIDHVCTRLGASDDDDLASPPSRHARREVEETIRQIIREQAGIQSFSDDEDFVRDLDMG
jgi:acyl carrier protein